MLLDSTEVKRLLPHRSPILMIDGVVDYQAGKSIVCTRNVGPSDPVFNGHFPGFPIMPGVLLLEAGAQSAALMIELDELGWQPGVAVPPGRSGEKIGVLASSKARFKRPVLPKSQIFIHGTIDWVRGPALSLSVKVTDELDKAYMTATLMVSKVLKESLNKSAKDEQLHRAI